MNVHIQATLQLISDVSSKVKQSKDRRTEKFINSLLLLPRNVIIETDIKIVPINLHILSRFSLLFCVSFLLVYPLSSLDSKAHYVTSRVPAYKEVKDVWKCSRYNILFPWHSLRFYPRCPLSLLSSIVCLFWLKECPTNGAFLYRILFNVCA